MSRKLRVALVFGGASTEHEVSLTSAKSVLAAIDRERYDVVPVAITREGCWLSGPQTLRMLEAKTNSGPADTGAAGTPSALLADPKVQGLVAVIEDGSARPQDRTPIDVVLPIIHGRHGEDGSLQGLLEMAGMPYVGCGVLASAVGMDKDACKRLLRDAGLPIVEYVCLRDRSWQRDWKGAERLVAEGPGFPCFVKPSNGGSSVGIVKVKDAGELRAALEEAARYDRKVLVERAVDAREIEVSVLGNETPEASVPGEIEPANEFYDYEAKYADDRSLLRIPAPVTEEQARQARRMAVEAFLALECEGMARVDFLLDRRSGALFLSEVNTVPGFTPISMYPKLWEASGLSYARLIDRLIELALERHRRNSRLRTRYEKGSSSAP